MREKLTKIIEAYEDVQAKMGDPAVLADQAALQKAEPSGSALTAGSAALQHRIIAGKGHDPEFKGSLHKRLGLFQLVQRI